MGLVVEDDGGRIPDRVWAQMELLLPERPSHPLGCHNPRVPDRDAMNAILLVLRTGMQWNALNATGICSCSSAYRRFREWVATAGTPSHGAILNCRRPCRVTLDRIARELDGADASRHVKHSGFGQSSRRGSSRPAHGIGGLTPMQVLGLRQGEYGGTELEGAGPT
jgi:hypothetical protein